MEVFCTELQFIQITIVFDQGDHCSRSFPAMLPSLPAGDHGMRNYNSEVEDDVPRISPNTVQNITPYLGLRSRLSQVWINRWTVLLFLILVRLLIAVAGLKHALGDAKEEAMSACSGVQSIGSAMASMPHYLSAGVNELAASGVEKAVSGLMSMLMLTLTGLEEMLVFYINMLTSTYLCLITLLVRGSLHVALKIIEEATDAVNKTMHDISSSLGTAVNGFDDSLNKFTGALNSIPKAFGGSNGDLPKLDLSQQQRALTTFTLPGDIDQGISKLNGSIPTFDEVQNFVDDVIRLPLEEVKKLVNASLHFSFNRSILPVPAKEKLTFCEQDNGIKAFFDRMAALANDARKIFIAVLLISALAVCIPMAWWEMRRFRVMKDRAKLVQDNSFDSLDIVYLVSSPYSATTGIKLASKFGSTRKQILVRWVVAYATSPPALFVLALGLTGLISCLFQYFLLKTIEKEAPALASEVGHFADKVVDALKNASSSWANGTNAAIRKVNDDINHDVLGWVNTTTGAVNGTLNAFIEKTTGVLNQTFANTVLADPILELFDCLVGLKVQGLQKGLTWVSDHARVDFPLLPNDTFSLGAAAAIGHDKSQDSDNFLADPGSNTTDKVSRAINKVIRRFADGIETETIISACVLLVWLVALLMGVGRAIWLISRAVKARGDGGPAPNTDMSHMERPITMLHGPAPAYEPPRNAPSTTNTNPFSEEVAVIPSRRNSVATDHIRDEKVGFAGMRQPAQEESPFDDPRRSVYPIVEKS